MSPCGVIPSADVASNGRRLQLLQTLLVREGIICRGDQHQTKRPRVAEREGYCGRREREHEVAWLVSSCARLGLHTDILSLAVAIFDRVLVVKDVQPKYANCLATASLYIAKKLCEDEEDSLAGLLRSLQLAYSSRDLKRMELVVLNLLGWDAYLPSLERFAAAQLAVLGCPWVLPYLRGPIEVALKNGSLARTYKASLVSLAIVSLILERFCTSTWAAMTNTLLHAHKLEWSDVLEAREAISRLIPSPPSLNPYSALSTFDDAPSYYYSDFCAPSVARSHVELASPRPLQPTQC